MSASVVSQSDVAAPEVPGPAREVSDRSTRLAAIVFGVYIAIAAWALLARLGNYFWFHGDEWEFLVTRDAGSLHDLLQPHNEHIATLPILLYRGLWHVFGLRSYTAYQIPVVAAHLTAAVLLRAVMRRCGVNPWIATAAASVFVLFGPGEENIIWAFQIGFTGSLVFGLGQLLLADHKGRFGMRDLVALGVGFLGLLCPGVSQLTTAIVGAVVLVHRGWRRAAFQVVPLYAAYAAWLVVIGPERITDPFGRATSWAEVFHFVRTGIAATFEGMAGGSAVLATIYVVALVAGLAVAWMPLSRTELIERAVTPVAFLVAGIAFFFISGYGRWWIGGDVGGSSRYVHLGAAFFLPPLAIAVDALARLWRPGVVIASLVLVATIPYGIGQFDTLPPFDRAYFDARRELVAELGRSPYLHQVPRSTRPDPTWSVISTGWLIDAERAGDLPKPASRTSASDPTARLRFGLTAIDARAPHRSCRTIRKPVDLSLHKGQELGVYVGPWSKPRPGWFFTQSYTMQLLQHGKPVGAALLVPPQYGHLLRAQLDDLHVRLGLAPGTEAFILCR